MTKHKYLLFLPLLLLLAAVACSSNKRSADIDSEGKPRKDVVVPDFCADSAYAYVKAQTDFGPRVPNSAAHVACGDYLAAKLESFGATVYNQRVDLATYDGHLLKARNIIGAYRPELKRRVVVFSHWDSRPWADHDPIEANRTKPVPGANDGASGVGVMLEIARQLQQLPTEIGVDLVFLDAEDYGARADYTGEHREEFWCLGSQYWARNPHVPNYNARFGILLDMVGGHGAEFRYEMVSEEYAHGINKKVWRAAEELGYDTYFVPRTGHYITDDHVFINRLAHIPTIDVIAFNEQHSFFEHWHTVNDDIAVIAPATLKAVGQTLLQVLYHEK